MGKVRGTLWLSGECWQADKKGDDKGEERHCGEAEKTLSQHPEL